MISLIYYYAYKINYLFQEEQMKPKILNIRLTLNRKTIANLSDNNMGNVRGGAEGGTYSAPPRCWSEEPTCTYMETCFADCTYAYSKNGKVC